MAGEPQRHMPPKGRDGALSALNMVIDGLNLAKEASSVTPAKTVFGTVAIILTMTRVCFLLPSPTGSPWFTQSGDDGQRPGLGWSRNISC